MAKVFVVFNYYYDGDDEFPSSIIREGFFDTEREAVRYIRNNIKHVSDITSDLFGRKTVNCNAPTYRFIKKHGYSGVKYTMGLDSKEHFYKYEVYDIDPED